MWQSNPLDVQDTVFPWIKKCKQVYIDLGSNIGVQVKKLFEPEKYPLRKKHTQALNVVLKLFDNKFGNVTERKSPKSSLCAFGFEPNPRHHKRLRSLQNLYNSKGWKVQFFFHAVSDEDKDVKFFVTKFSPVDLGATLSEHMSHKKQSIMTHAVQLSQFLVRKLHLEKIALMKMDVEGEEIEVLLDLFTNNLLCKHRIDTILLELHKSKIKQKWKIFGDVSNIVNKMANQTSCDPSQIIRNDDESYRFDVN